MRGGVTNDETFGEARFILDATAPNTGRGWQGHDTKSRHKIPRGTGARGRAVPSCPAGRGRVGRALCKFLLSFRGAKFSGFLANFENQRRSGIDTVDAMVCGNGLLFCEARDEIENSPRQRAFSR
jgi:hypothetical protein